jgi:hypothetical protein
MTPGLGYLIRRLGRLNGSDGRAEAEDEAVAEQLDEGAFRSRRCEGRQAVLYPQSRGEGRRPRLCSPSSHAELLEWWRQADRKIIRLGVVNASGRRTAYRVRSRAGSAYGTMHALLVRSREVVLPRTGVRTPRLTERFRDRRRLLWKLWIRRSLRELKTRGTGESGVTLLNLSSHYSVASFGQSLSSRPGLTSAKTF